MYKDIKNKVSDNILDNLKKKKINKENKDENKNKLKNIDKVLLYKKYTELKKKMIIIQKKIIDINDAFLRAKAEIENIKRRSQNEINKVYKFAIDKFAESLLSVKDSLEATLKINITSIESIKNGVYTTLKQLSNTFKKNNLLEINPKCGDKLDPMKHQVISTIKSKNNETNIIINVLQKGYMLYDRLLRPAFVIVSSKINE